MKKIKILNVKIDNVSFQESLKRIEGFLKSDSPNQIVTVNPEFIMAAQRDRDFLKILNSASLAVPDGIGLIWASKFLYGNKNKLTERVTGVDLVWAIAKMASEKGWSIYFLGAGPGVARIAANRLKLLHKNLKIAGVSVGEPKYFEKSVVEGIRKSGADILFVAYGAPKQEKFIYKNLKDLKVKVAMGVGGSFDFIAGKQVRAPRWLQKIGFEWLWRLFFEPRRINRILTAVVRFPLKVIFSKYQK